MKILIVSDVHGNYLNMKKVLEQEPIFDYFFLLGDVLSGPDIDGYNPDQLAELLNQYSNKIFYVRGNCDHYRMDLLDFYMEKDYVKYEVDSALGSKQGIIIVEYTKTTESNASKPSERTLPGFL